MPRYRLTIEYDGRPYKGFQAQGELPTVRGSDDADKARWFPVAEALEMGPRLFEDHLHILEYFIGRG